MNTVRRTSVHRSLASTEIYTKVAVETLRDVALGDGEEVLLSVRAVYVLRSYNYRRNRFHGVGRGSFTDEQLLRHVSLHGVGMFGAKH